MITLQNQLTLQFNIGNIYDFIQPEDFYSFRIAENCGGLRPIINLSFSTMNQDAINLMNTGNAITLMYGMREPTSEILQFEICGDNKSKQFRAGNSVSILGAMFNNPFTSIKKSEPILNSTSVEAIRQIAARNNMNFVTNVTKTMDKQDWYPSGRTDWSFLHFIAQRAYKDTETFFNYGFDNNTIYLYDIKQLLRQGIKWCLTVTGTGKEGVKNIINIGGFKCDDTNAGINGDLIGKNVIGVSYNLDSGEFYKPNYNLKSLTTMDTDSINLNSTDCATYEYNITTNDEHKYSVEAQKQNLKNQILYSSYNCHVVVADDYHDFKLMDTVMLIPGDEDKEAEGVYFITGIVKQYSKNQYKTILTMNRESANGIKGDLESGVTTSNNVG